MHYVLKTFLTEIISMCKTTVNYNAGDRDMISFKGNTPCRVMSKSVGEDYDLWEISVSLSIYNVCVFCGCIIFIPHIGTRPTRVRSKKHDYGAKNHDKSSQFDSG